MDSENQKTVQWTPEWESKFQYVQKQYDNARFMGIDILKLFLQVVIATNVIPFIFHDKIITLFKNHIWLIYCSWICIILSVLTGFIAYFFIFEGYYHHAHFEASRWLLVPSEENNERVKIKEYSEASDSFFNKGHYFGIFTVAFFILGIAFIIAAICKLFW